MSFLISKEYPNRFLSGDEVVGKSVDVVIRDVKKEQVFSPKTQKKENALVVYFEGKDRGVCLGKERANELRAILVSDDTEGWKGKSVQIYTKKKYAFGRMNNVLHFKKAGSANTVDVDEEQIMIDQSGEELDPSEMPS